MWAFSRAKSMSARKVCRGIAASLHLLGTGDLRAAQAAAEIDAHAFDLLVGHDFLDGLLHDAAEWQALFERFGDHHAR